MNPATREPDWVKRTPRGNRLVYLRTAILNELRRDLSDILSPKVAKEIFYRTGLAVGRTAMTEIRQMAGSEEEFWRVRGEICEARGWGHIARHEKTTHDDGLTVTVIFQDSAFADGVKATESVCDILRGAFASGVAIFYGGRVVKSDETQCRATGAPNCIFIIELK